MALPRNILIIIVLNTLVLIASTGLNVYLLSGSAAKPDAAENASMPAAADDQLVNKEYQFFPVEKIIVNLRGGNRERYFVLDLVLQADLTVEQGRLQQIDPIVRNSVVANLSAMSFEELRGLSINEVQQQLEAALTADLLEKQLNKPFDHVLVSKMIVQ